MIAKKNWGTYAVAVVFSIVTSVFFALFSTATGKIVDAVSLSQERLIQSIVLAIIYLIAWNVSRLGFVYVKNRFIRDILVALKERLYSVMMRQSIREHATQGEASYLNDLSKNIDLLEEDWLGPMCELAEDGFTILISVTTLLLLEWRLTAIFFVISVLTVVLSQVPSLFLQKSTSQFSGQSEHYLGTVTNHLKGYEQVKLLGIESLFIGKFAQVNQAYEGKRFRYNMTLAASSNVTRLVSFLSQLACMAAGAWLVWRGEFTVGGLIAAVQLLNGVFNPLQFMIQNTNVMKATKEIREKITNNLQAVAESGDDLDSIHQVSFRHVSYRTDERVLFDDFTHTFDKGHHYAIIGPSGIGKSTLMKLLLQYVPASDYTGEIRVDEASVATIAPDALLRRIAYIQTNDFLENGTVLDNIQLGRSLDLSQPDTQSWLQAMRMTESLLNKVAFESTQQVSQGEKQRIDLLRFVANLDQYDVVLFDEPTSHVDPQTAQAIMEQVLAIPDKIVIVITHNHDAALLNQFDDVIRLGIAPEQ